MLLARTETIWPSQTMVKPTIPVGRLLEAFAVPMRIRVALTIWNVHVAEPGKQGRRTAEALSLGSPYLSVSDAATRHIGHPANPGLDRWPIFLLCLLRLGALSAVPGQASARSGGLALFCACRPRRRERGHTRTGLGAPDENALCSGPAKLDRGTDRWHNHWVSFRSCWIMDRERWSSGRDPAVVGTGRAIEEDVL
jgi:hypothetical protein